MRFESELECVKHWINKDAEFIARQRNNKELTSYQQAHLNGRECELNSIMEVIKSIEE